jgi:Putative Ig domain
MSARTTTAMRAVLRRWVTPAVLVPLAAGLGSMVIAPQAALAAPNGASSIAVRGDAIWQLTPGIAGITPATPITFTSSASDTVLYGSAFSFTVTTSGTPTPAIIKAGLMPVGVTLTDNGDGTATLAGTPTGRSGGVYPLTFIAKSVHKHTLATQAFTLTVNRDPAFKTTGTVRAEVGTSLNQTITARGYPVPVLTESGPLPLGVSFTDNGNGTASLTGTPVVGTGGSYPVTVTATSGIGIASETFNLKVGEPPAITSLPAATAVTGSPFSFTVTATGFPAPQITESGALPKGLKFEAASSTFTGTPKAGTAGVYTITITAKNRSATVTQTFTLTVT